jgi:hypothetical protein
LADLSEEWYHGVSVGQDKARPFWCVMGLIPFQSTESCHPWFRRGFVRQQ